MSELAWEVLAPELGTLADEVAGSSFGRTSLVGDALTAFVGQEAIAYAMGLQIADAGGQGIYDELSRYDRGPQPPQPRESAPTEAQDVRKIAKAYGLSESDARAFADEMIYEGVLPMPPGGPPEPRREYTHALPFGIPLPFGLSSSGAPARPPAQPSAPIPDLADSLLGAIEDRIRAVPGLKSVRRSGTHFEVKIEREVWQ